MVWTLGFLTLFVLELTACAVVRLLVDFHTGTARRVELWAFAKCISRYLERFPLSTRSWNYLLLLQAVPTITSIVMSVSIAVSYCQLPLLVFWNVLYRVYFVALWTRLLLPKAVLSALMYELRQRCLEHTQGQDDEQVNDEYSGALKENLSIIRLSKLNRLDNLLKTN